ncbi:hypothetical protein RHAA1_03451 [Aggregatibacter actinomycetemcomitans RhAA1]|nr:hypothetical protein RHAA1_03451 [Aggregatibacter actinomycetemcomitans RhAA1]
MSIFLKKHFEKQPHFFFAKNLKLIIYSHISLHFMRKKEYLFLVFALYHFAYDQMTGIFVILLTKSHKYSFLFLDFFYYSTVLFIKDNLT